jgi:hypothetical protein
MSRYHDDPDTARRRIYRALVVDAYTDVSWAEYIRRAKGRER